MTAIYHLLMLTLLTTTCDAIPTCRRSFYSVSRVGHHVQFHCNSSLNSSDKTFWTFSPNDTATESRINVGQRIKLQRFSITDNDTTILHLVNLSISDAGSYRCHDDDGQCQHSTQLVVVNESVCSLVDSAAAVNSSEDVVHFRCRLSFFGLKSLENVHCWSGTDHTTVQVPNITRATNGQMNATWTSIEFIDAVVVDESNQRFVCSIKVTSTNSLTITIPYNIAWNSFHVSSSTLPAEVSSADELVTTESRLVNSTVKDGWLHTLGGIGGYLIAVIVSTLIVFVMAVIYIIYWTITKGNRQVYTPGVSQRPPSANEEQRDTPIALLRSVSSIEEHCYVEIVEPARQRDEDTDHEQQSRYIQLDTSTLGLSDDRSKIYAELRVLEAVQM